MRQLAEKFRQVREQAAADAEAAEEKQNADAASKPPGTQKRKKSQKSGKSGGIYDTMAGGPVATGPELGHVDEWDVNGRTALHHAVYVSTAIVLLSVPDEVLAWCCVGETLKFRAVSRVREQPWLMRNVLLHNSPNERQGESQS